eukprot:12998199-Ditylum_brightwellii.AAC.1
MVEKEKEEKIKRNTKVVVTNITVIKICMSYLAEYWTQYCVFLMAIIIPVVLATPTLTGKISPLVEETVEENRENLMEEEVIEAPPLILLKEDNINRWEMSNAIRIGNLIPFLLSITATMKEELY